MTIRNLDALLQPKSVALVGAGTRPGSVGLIMTRNMLKAGFQGTLSLVNPKHREIEGVPCHDTIAALPDVPDLAVVVTPPATLPGIIAELGAKGTRAAVVITAGIRGDLRQAMLNAARPHLLRIQGPNCLGLVNVAENVMATFSQFSLGPTPDGPAAFVTQSGALGTATAGTARKRGLNFGYFVNTGNETDIQFVDVMRAIIAEEHAESVVAAGDGDCPNTRLCPNPPRLIDAI